MGLEKNLSEIVQGIGDKGYKTLVVAMKAGKHAPHPEHFVLLDHIRKGGKCTDEHLPHGLSEEYKKKIRVNRHRLYNYVCKALAQFEGPETQGRLVRQTLEVAHALLFRGHINQALEWINEAKKDATEACDHVLLVECLDLERVVLKDVRGSEVQREANRSAIRAALQTLHTVADLRLMADELLDIIRNGSNDQNSPMRKRADEIMAHPLVAQSDLAVSFKARSHRLSMLSVYNRWLNNLPEALKFANEHLALWELHSEMVQHMPQAYIGAVSNVLSFSLLLDKNASWLELKHLLDKPALKSKALRAQLYRATEMNYLLHRLKNGFYKEVARDRDRIKNTMDQLGNHLQPSFVVSINWNLAFHALITNELRVVQTYFNRIVEGRRDPAKPQLLALACAFEAWVMAERDVLTPDDLVRLLKVHDASNGANDISLAIFNLLPTLTEGRSEKQWKNSLLSLWGLLVQFDNEKTPIGTDDLALWLYARLTDRPMPEVIANNLHLQALHNRIDDPTVSMPTE